MRLLRLTLAVLAAWLVAAPLAAQDFPPVPDGPVYDGADILTPEQEAALTQRLYDLPTQTGNTLIVATVPSLDGATIEGYAFKLYETWGIGGESRDTGALLLVAPNERRVRIEVGYGLTPVITDIFSGRVVREEITPRFKAGDLYGGIDAGVTALVNQMSLEPEDAQAIAEAAATAEANRSSEGANIGGVIFWIVMLVFFIAMFSRGGRGRRYRGGGVAGAVGEVILWSAINAAANSDSWGGGGGGSSWGGGGGGGGFGGFGGGMSGGGGASGSW